MLEIKGKLIAIGGAEDKGTEIQKLMAIHHNLNFFELGILRRIVDEAGGVLARIEVITTASMTPFEVGNNYLEAFGRIGCTNIGVMHIRTREDVQNEEYLDRIEKCDAVMFTGGNQMRLTSIFGGTKLLRIVQNRYRSEEFIVAGTSAGAMAMSNTMIYEGDATKAHLKGEVKITTGLAFMDRVIFDSHFEKRGRFGRLSQAVGANPSCIGIGLGEDTGMLITEGNKMEAIGSGLVVIIDGHDIRHSNIADIPEGSPMSVENIRVHLCAKGNGFLVQERKFVEHMAKETTPVMKDWD
ncbi:cyanophycinase [Segetibacter koreensis]|uniref:cyanophycinase n=1 Tax=Segetibacter koreensis TaxID=398037 RepID=UPI0003700405|nr:cyanophycinase [Segetibacter koreensis]